MRLISFHLPITGPALLAPKTNFTSKETPNKTKAHPDKIHALRDAQRTTIFTRLLQTDALPPKSFKRTAQDRINIVISAPLLQFSTATSPHLFRRLYSHKLHLVPTSRTKASVIDLHTQKHTHKHTHTHTHTNTHTQSHTNTPHIHARTRRAYPE